MSYLQYFIDENKPLVKPKFVAVEEDWQFLCTIFPEPGFRSYFCGHIISKLTAELKAHGIKTYHDREERPEFASLTGLLSNIKFVGDTPQPDERRGVGGIHEGDESGTGEPTNHAFTSFREFQSAQAEKASSEARHELARLVVPRDRFPFSAEDIKRALSG